MSETVNQRRNNAKSEFFQIIKTYIIPLLNKKGNCKLIDSAFKNKSFIERVPNSNLVNIFPLVSNNDNILSPFYVQIKLNDECTISKSLCRILVELLKISEYNYYDFTIKRHYGKSKARQLSYKKSALNLAYELGICEWLTSCENDAVVLHTVITQIINWSCRTYEGKKVPFGIVINFAEKTNNEADYLNFLNNDSSAVFTDGIFSGILLDRKGHVLSFLTRNTVPSESENPKKQMFVPYQFEDITKHCTNSAIGVMALKNGEIILVKEQAITFAKRGNKWINFNWERVYHSLRPYFKKDKSLTEDDIYRKIQELYCTMLDVSFAHSGGCIAIVIPEKENQDEVGKIIKERIDLCDKGEFPSGISAESKEKMIIMSYLLSYQTSEMQSFFNIDRVLRKEIIGLDGATVISLNGSFYCAGSIVAVTSDSSGGGGRTAAAKKLSSLGVGIKISEDGYIEAYGLNLSNTSERMIRLFEFK